MEIGTLGAGAFAQAFAKRALKAGYKVKLSTGGQSTEQHDRS
jgi:3-hydroxyisobutyrate dehydrogenase-like beta-hydroxyacid dehydrogenase